MTEEAKYIVREVVGVVDNVNDLESAIDLLEENGFDRAAINLMAATETVDDAMDGKPHSIQDLEDDPEARQALYVNKHELAEAESALIGVPIYIGAIAGALGVVATGGALALAAAAAAAGGAAGGGLGAIFANAIGARHAELLTQSMARGGLGLWVRVSDDAQMKTAIKLLNEVGAADVHHHRIERSWGEDDIPLSHWQPDPFLTKE